MDRGASRPFGLGKIAGLSTAHPKRLGWWRVAGSLVILVAMAGLALALVDRLQSEPPAVGPASHPPPPVPAIAPARAVSPASDMLRRGLEAAQQGAAGDAAALFRKALEIDSRNAEGWNDLGGVLH